MNRAMNDGSASVDIALKLAMDDLENRFTYHPPKGDQQARYVALRNAGKALAVAILTQTPLSAEQTLAIHRVEEAVMWANAAIARNE